MHSTTVTKIFMILKLKTQNYFRGIYLHSFSDDIFQKMFITGNIRHIS